MPSLSKHLITSHPGKFIFATLSLIFNAIRLPFWIFLYAIPAFRPLPSWSFRQALMVRIVKAYLGTTSRIQVKTSLPLLPGRERERFVLIPPASPDTYTGIVNQDPGISPEKIGAIWYSPPYHTDHHEKVVLHFHGGAYVIGDGRPQNTKFLAHGLVRHGGFKVLSVAYRLASNPDGRFPAALQDAISAYAYLIRVLDVPSHKILLAGDSAGGNLVLALLRYLNDHPTILPVPAGAILFSPWVDLVTASIRGIIAKSPNAHTDYLHQAFSDWGTGQFIPANFNASHPYLTPLNTPFATVPLFIQTGTAEVLYFDNIKIGEQFQQIAGNQVKIHVSKNAPHDIALMGHLLGWKHEVYAFMGGIKEWAAALQAPNSNY